MKTSILGYASLLLSLILSSAAFAAEISLYDQPTTTAKTIGSIDVSSGLIPIYTPKDNHDWMKVGDPRNGNVGWIKSADLNKAMGKSSSGVTFTQKIITDGSGGHGYQVQYNQPVKSLANSPTTILPSIELKPLSQQQIQQTINDAVKQINALYQQQLKAISAGGQAPIMMPIVVLPMQSQPVPVPSAPTKK